MLTERQIERMLSKLSRFEKTLDEKMFEVVDTISMDCYHTMQRLHEVPDDTLFTPSTIGEEWGGDSAYAWFKGKYQIPEKLAGKNLYLYPKTGGYEAMMWVNGVPYGNFASKLVIGSHGNHYCDLFVQNAAQNTVIDVALEYYAGHYCIGTVPLQTEVKSDFMYKVGSADVCVKNEQVSDFLFDLKTLNQLVKVLDTQSFRRADVINTLTKVHEILFYSYDDTTPEVFLQALKNAAPLLKAKLADKNSVSAPYAGIIGHSHMDTAWLWNMDETIEKCARTYSNQLNLMNQYPEYKFVQSSAFHSEMIRLNYPKLFEQIRERISEGRYEPNGGVWVECDCNLVSGESLVRQFVWGQRYTREHFNYTADSFWLPDTFGYSPAIPQIMKKSKVNYFLTTKMAWNDTNTFPYDSFYWQGLDGTKVLAHLNKTHIWPSPEGIMEYVSTGNDSIKERGVSNSRLISFGCGDGGGGPEFEMLEMARRVEDLEGLPRTKYTSVSEFMEQLESSMVNPSTYSGELYLELHRGTLTNQHQIKQNNRYAENALHNLEYITVRNAISQKEKACDTKIRPLYNLLLVNQFHDILPGTCIPQVHERSIKETSQVIKHATELTNSYLNKSNDSSKLSAVNTLSFDRNDTVYCSVSNPTKALQVPCQQMVDSILNGKQLALGGVSLPAFGAKTFDITSGLAESNSAFEYKENVLTTPFAKVTFNENGFMSSFIDLRNDRELCATGYPLNTFLIAEDVPSDWDNWDVDADLELKFRDTAKLISRKVVDDGAVEFRIRSSFKLTDRSNLEQDMIFYSTTPEVRFETKMDWQDNHRFLKVAFDTDIQSDFSRQEVQFGCIKRSTTRNTSIEKAKFEVSNQKYSDISDTRYGVSILNDCKYGITVKDGQLRLSLHKGGNRPDYNGDHGTHTCTYSFLPHMGTFSAETVVKPAYCLNMKPLMVQGTCEMESLLHIDADNIIVETIKPCEENDNAFIVRIYECEGAHTKTNISIPLAVQIAKTNMLEDIEEVYSQNDNVEITFTPFEIHTLKVSY